jgi:hypothetical protein
MPIAIFGVGFGYAELADGRMHPNHLMHGDADDFFGGVLPVCHPIQMV